MPLRDFSDSRGNRWRVWNTVPAQDAALDPELRDGWLTFECDGTRRRLAPIPSDWESADAHELETFCSQAVPVTRVSGAA